MTRQRRYLTRSSYETFSQCQRKGYYQFMKSGTGFVPAVMSHHLLVGLSVHKGIEEALKGTDISPEDVVTNEWLSHAPLDLSDEKQEAFYHLAIGLVAAWRRWRLDWWLSNWEILSIEKEIEVPLAHDLILQARADLVAREKSSGLVYVVNWKTTGAKKDWTLRWRYDIQAMTEALAVQEDLGENVVGCLFEGIYKGSYEQGGLPRSPLVTAYSDGNVFELEASKARATGWERIRPWQSFPGGDTGWVEFLPDEVLSDLFVLSEPILKNDDRVRLWLKQVVARESSNRQMLLEEVPEEDRETYFWQNPSSQCRWCEYAQACWEGLDLAEMPTLKPRVDHHGTVDKAETKP